MEALKTLHERNWRESLHVQEFHHPPKFLEILAATPRFQIITGLPVPSTTCLPVLSVVLFWFGFGILLTWSISGFPILIIRSWHWGRWGRRRRCCSPWRSGAGYFPRSPSCRGRCAGQGASGQRRGRRRGRRGRSRKGGWRESRRATHVQHGVKMTDTRTTWANVVWHMISETWSTTNGALLCSLVQIVRVVIVRVILDGVLCVMIGVLIGLDEVLVIYEAIFIVIFCNWRCTLYTPRRRQWTALTVTNIITVILAPNSLWDSCHKKKTIHWLPQVSPFNQC